MGGVAKRVIYRRVENHAVIRLAKRLVQVVNGGDGAVCERDPFSLYINVMTPVLPGHNGVIESVMGIAVAIRSVLCNFDKGFANGGRSGEVHVGDPHGNIVLFCIRELLLDDFSIPFACMIERSIGHDIEVKLRRHANPFHNEREICPVRDLRSNISVSIIPRWVFHSIPAPFTPGVKPWGMFGFAPQG